MPIKVRPHPRRINPNPAEQYVAPRQKSDAALVVERSHARQILELPRPQLDIVINSINDGVGNSVIAHFFGEQGWLTVTEKTFTQYLASFKRVYPDLLNRGDEDSLNGFQGLSKIQPEINEEAALEQLIRMQSMRMRINLKFEKETNLLNVHAHKDVLATKELIETLASLRGKTSGAGRPNSQSVKPMNNEAQEQLRKADIGEATQDKLAGLVAGLIPLVEAKHHAETVKNKA